MKLLSKFRLGKNGTKRAQPTFVSPYPVVNRMLSSDPIDALLLQMEMEMWSEEEVLAAFDTGLTEEECVNMVWNDTWQRMGAELHHVMQERINALPEDQRRQLADGIEQC